MLAHEPAIADGLCRDPDHHGGLGSDGATPATSRVAPGALAQQSRHRRAQHPGASRNVSDRRTLIFLSGPMMNTARTVALLAAVRPSEVSPASAGSMS